MNEFDKSQDKGKDTGEQGDKPAFGQFDKEQQQKQEQGQDEGGEQIPEDRQQQQGEIRKDELTSTGEKPGGNQDTGGTPQTS